MAHKKPLNAVPAWGFWSKESGSWVLEATAYSKEDAKAFHDHYKAKHKTLTWVMTRVYALKG